MKTERLTVQVLVLLNGGQFIYLFIFLSFCFVLFFLGRGGGGGGGLATQFLITSYCVVHNPSSFFVSLIQKTITYYCIARSKVS